MKAKKVLFITSEMVPFVPESPRSLRGRFMPQAIQELGHEIRTFSPKWGIINERRNQLHEVIRLSGMNLIIDDTDHPLIIKVASILSARMQIYFIDNDEFFLHKGLLADENGNEYPENGERTIFYARGVLETMKKLRWVPDVIHCHGWATALAPLYIKKAYQDEPSFCDAKVVFSVSEKEFEADLGKHLLDIIPFKGIKTKDYSDICTDKCTFEDLSKIAIKFSDGVIVDNKEVPECLIEYAKSTNKPILEPIDEEAIPQAYSDFYDSLME